MKLDKTATETYKLLKEIYGNEYLSCTQVFVWFKRFQDGGEDRPVDFPHRFLYIHGVVYLHWVPKGQTNNQHYYREVLARLCERERKKTTRIVKDHVMG